MARTATSFGHTLWQLAEHEARTFSGERWHCHKCKSTPCEFASIYSYVTGRGGRVTDRRQYVCRSCAAKFAAKHGLEMPG